MVINVCRFVAYMGKNILLSDILIKPEYSLIKQSLLSRESRTVTNGDGFGLAWYPTFSKNPALFTSLSPAWNDRNLAYLAKKTKAPLFFGHVRAASSGGISQFNCHPFLYKNWMFMHNGWIPFFDTVKREFHNLLDDDIYKWVKGSTDSEIIFALFLQLAKKHQSNKTLNIEEVLQDTLDAFATALNDNPKKVVVLDPKAHDQLLSYVLKSEDADIKQRFYQCCNQSVARAAALQPKTKEAIKQFIPEAMKPQQREINQVIVEGHSEEENNLEENAQDESVVFSM